MKDNTKIWYWAGGLTTVGLVTTALVVRNKKKRRQKMLMSRRQVSAQSKVLPQTRVKPLNTIKSLIPYRNTVNIMNTNKNTLPSNFRNRNGGSSYLFSSPRGIRNNNPGNLVQSGSKWKGKLPKHQNKDRRFEMFISFEYGVRAMIKLLQNYMKKDVNTIEKILNKYAPTFENNTKAYIRKVSKDLNVSQTTKLLPTKNTLQQLVFSIAKVENGGNYMTKELFEKAYALL